MSEEHRGAHWSRGGFEPKPITLVRDLRERADATIDADDRSMLLAAASKLHALTVENNFIRAQEKVRGAVDSLLCWNCRRAAVTMRPPGQACTICAEAYDMSDYATLSSVHNSQR
jgi:hypothetical protein